MMPSNAVTAAAAERPGLFGAPPGPMETIGQLLFSPNRPRRSSHGADAANEERPFKNRLEADLAEAYLANGLPPNASNRICLLTHTGGLGVQCAHFLRHTEHSECGLQLALVALALLPAEPDVRATYKCTINNIIPLWAPVRGLIDDKPTNALIMPTLAKAIEVVEELERAWLQVEIEPSDTLILPLPLAATSSFSDYFYYHLEHSEGLDDQLDHIRRKMPSLIMHEKIDWSEKHLPVKWDPPLPAFQLRIPTLIALLNAQYMYRGRLPPEQSGDVMFTKTFSPTESESFVKVLQLGAYAALLCTADSVTAWRTPLRPAFLPALPPAAGVGRPTKWLFPGIEELAQLIGSQSVSAELGPTTRNNSSPLRPTTQLPSHDPPAGSLEGVEANRASSPTSNGTSSDSESAGFEEHFAELSFSSNETAATSAPSMTSEGPMREQQASSEDGPWSAPCFTMLSATAVTAWPRLSAAVLALAKDLVEHRSAGTLIKALLLDSTPTAGQGRSESYTQRLAAVAATDYLHLNQENFSITCALCVEEEEDDERAL